MYLLRKKIRWCQTQYHEVLPTEDYPEGEEHGVEDALPDVSKKQHPGPVKANREPLHWDVDKRHGDTESKYNPGSQEIFVMTMHIFFYIS